ncbi:DUF2252 domain-containing protein [Amycolatopsis sp. OK19-0408]|uniref:DUF2252 domain-containing protein n=1 Tax=Amycolatopsis iheyensis TaxID=2945988 RepID=A0A9X2SKI5_9PSEU|nr:DUF2252 domain-containing protein [Amycolatopsis iheyensis]
MWLTGDAHLENTSADNEEQFALDDTDGTWRRSWTSELRREAVSIALAGGANGRSASRMPPTSAPSSPNTPRGSGSSTGPATRRANG